MTTSPGPVLVSCCGEEVVAEVLDGLLAFWLELAESDDDEELGGVPAVDFEGLLDLPVELEAPLLLFLVELEPLFCELDDEDGEF